MYTILKLTKYVEKRKKLGLLPILTFLLFIASIIFYTQGSAVAPFTYTIF
jgi:hypothetical protein